MKWEKWQQLRDKTADLTLRERGILAGTVVVLLLVIWKKKIMLLSAVYIE